MNVPISRLEPQQGGMIGVGRTTEVTRDEVKFSKFIQRLRNKFSTVFDQALRIQLVLKGICTTEEWELFKEDIYFSPYRVSTITCNANIGKDINLNLKMLFDNILIVNKENSEAGVVWVQYMKEGEELNRGEYPKKRRKSKKNTLRNTKYRKTKIENA